MKLDELLEPGNLNPDYETWMALCKQKFSKCNVEGNATHGAKATNGQVLIGTWDPSIGKGVVYGAEEQAKNQVQSLASRRDLD